MFARNVSIRLKPNSSVAFTKQIENETIPTLRKQKGFQGELTFLAPSGAEAVAISLWDNKENGEAYARTGYPEVLKSLNKFVEGFSRTTSRGSCRKPNSSPAPLYGEQTSVVCGCG